MRRTTSPSVPRTRALAYRRNKPGQRSATAEAAVTRRTAQQAAITAAQGREFHARSVRRGLPAPVQQDTSPVTVIINGAGSTASVYVEGAPQNVLWTGPAHEAMAVAWSLPRVGMVRVLGSLDVQAALMQQPNQSYQPTPEEQEPWNR